jgi:hypothetical protein
MPMHSFGAFGPEVIAEMTEALEAACEELGDTHPKMAGQAERQSPYSFLPLDLHMLLAATWNAPLGVAVRARRP